MQSPSPYPEKAIEKNGENQIRQIKEKLTKSNAYRNDWKFQLNWNKLEWVYKIYILGIIHSVLWLSSSSLNMENRHVIFCTLKLKLIDCVALLKLQEESAALTENISSSTVSQINKTASTTSATSVK